MQKQKKNVALMTDIPIKNRTEHRNGNAMKYATKTNCKKKKNTNKDHNHEEA